MSTPDLDSRWPITSPAWSVGVSPESLAACWRVRLYAVAAEACVLRTGSRDAQACAGSVVSALASHPLPERERICAVLVAEGLAGPIVGALIGWALQQRREDLTHDALCRDPHCPRRRARGAA